MYLHSYCLSFRPASRLLSTSSTCSSDDSFIAFADVPGKDRTSLSILSDSECDETDEESEDEEADEDDSDWDEIDDIDGCVDIPEELQVRRLMVLLKRQVIFKLDSLFSECWIAMSFRTVTKASKGRRRKESGWGQTSPSTVVRE